MDQSTRSSVSGVDLCRMYAGSAWFEPSAAVGARGYTFPEKEKYEPTLDPAVNLLINTQLCARQVAKGSCNKKDCTFAHSEEELRPLPDLRKTKWCRLVFHSLPCTDGNCPYAHTVSELRSNAQDLVSYKTSFCKYFQRGNCLSGIHCRFAHCPSELRNPNDHPRCAEVREQLSNRNRELQKRRQEARMAAQAQQEAGTGEGNNAENQNSTVTGSGPGAANVHTAVQVFPPGLAHRSSATGLQAKNNSNCRRKKQHKEVNSNEPLKPFVHRPRASLDANLAAAYSHARRRAKIEQQQRAKEEQERLTRMSRLSTSDCLHPAQEEMLSSNSSGSDKPE
ncbi:hypothetical protein Esti_000786 [Eimeria stiedai]